MTPARASAGYIPWWLLAGVAGACLLASLVLAGLAAATRTADLPRATATARLVTAPPVTAAAPETPAAAAPTPAPVEPPTATAPPPPAGEVAVGGYVQVTGTGEAGFLNLRAEANLTAPVNYLAIEREVFQVQAGPVSADGFTWWYLVDPATSTRYGWAVQNYLQVVQGP
ncbi:MAG: hypothetical protein JNK29_05515 [Anaerolineales bacterium]|nr:hypothetical protein [Anaerolineales bacterium]